MHIELCKRISYAPFKFCPCVLHVPSHHHHHSVRDYINHYLTDTLCFLVLSSPMCNIFERGGGGSQTFGGGIYFRPVVLLWSCLRLPLC